MKKDQSKNLIKPSTEIESSQTQPVIEIETVKLAKVKTGVMAGICAASHM